MIALPTSASAIPPSAPKSGRGCVKKSMFSALRPLKTTVPSTSARIATAAIAETIPEARHQLLRDAPASQPVRRASDVVRVDGLVDGAHAALRAFSKRRTISWAATLVTSEIAIRIAAR